MSARDRDLTPSGLALVVRRTIVASPQRVFEAWTDPEHLRRWWGPRSVTCPSAEIDLRVGGRYRIENRFTDGHSLWIVGQFEVIAPPDKLVFSWHLEPGSGAAERVTVRFEPRDGATEVIIVHEQIASPESRETHAMGWQECLEGLEQHLGRTGVDDAS
jgi:uncharacterized protein YndB with AHSA1/START domain